MPKKLTNADKEEILQLYRNTEETTSTLAVRYGVSNSTISRFLKSNLPEVEYEKLIQQKRGHRTEETPELPEESEVELVQPPPLETVPSDFLSVEEFIEPPQEWEDILGEELDDDDWDDSDDEDDLELEFDSGLGRSGGGVVQVLPFAEADLPRICYLVVDRSGELVARPMRDFSDLGSIPDQETQEKTLPVFDHHKIAQRFSNRFQRVIKVPDGRMIDKTRSQLKAKGITRLLINGQIYTLV